MAALLGVTALGSQPARTLTPTRFGDDFELDVRSYELRRSGQALKLERIPMEVLILLIEFHGQLVTRDQIVERIWGKGTFLDTDNSINAAIRKIRQVLGDDPEQPRFVQTVTGKGYRFVAPVQEGSPPSAQASEGSAPSPESLLGTRISHYRLLHILGGGGMGVVYKAEDLRLGRSVALKLLPADLASDPIAFERLQREARAASSLDHPNICSIYQLGEHKGQPFIVLQLLEGQTLREWIESTTSQGTPAHIKHVLELAIQILHGLEAAHEKGIIHRDIKPANIFVTSRGQAKLLDFGVAKFLDATEPVRMTSAPSTTEEAPSCRSSDSQLTKTGASIGTPSYLSPEQIRGEKLDCRTDLFSFGLVLYEMATGKQAYSGKTVAEIRNAVLNLPSTPASRLNPNISPELERIITKSLEKVPDHRYQKAGDLRQDLLALNKRSGGASAPRVRALAWIGSALLVIALVLLAVNFSVIKAHLPGRANAARTVPGKTRRSVAILGFKNLSGDRDKAWISTALSEMVAAELAEGQQLRVIPSEDVARMKLDLALPVADSYGQDTLKKIHSQLSSDIVVLGSYLDIDRDTAGRIRIDFELQDTSTGETLAVVSREGTESNLANLVAQGGADLRQRLGVNHVSADDERHVMASLPSNPEAARLYAEGLEKLQTYDARASRDMLEKAVALDPNHAMSHSLLAESYYALGYEAKAQEEARKAFDLSANLSREEKLSIEGRYRELSHDLPSAIEDYRTLRNFFPDDINYALRLATAQTNATLGNDALQTISLMGKLPSPINQDIRIDIAEASAAETLSDFKRSQEAATRAEAKAAAQGSYLLLATAKVREAGSSAHLGDLDRAFASYTKARELWLQGGNSRGAAAALHGIANIERDQGNFVGARKSFEEALAEFRRIGAMRDLGSCTHNFGVLLSYQGNLREAKKQLDEALRIQRELRYQLGVASDLDDIGNVLESLGDLTGAELDKNEALQIFRSLNNRFGESTTLLNLGEVLLAGGRLSQAKEKFEQAMAVAQKIGEKRNIGYCLKGLAAIDLAQDHLPEARNEAEQSLALRSEMKDEAAAAASKAELAEIALDQGKASEAEALARTACQVFLSQKSLADGGQCYAILTRGLIKQGKVDEAHDAAGRALSLSQESGDVMARFDATLAVAAVQVRNGELEQAAKTLQAMRTESASRGFLGFELKARLLLGELELQSGNRSAGKASLQQMQRDAANSGFLLISREAGAALSSPSPQPTNPLRIR
jgi:serine/threonine protein kinase/tetratricopeptide (TPR) repeat protein/TolB-like protein